MKAPVPNQEKLRAALRKKVHCYHRRRQLIDAVYVRCGRYSETGRQQIREAKRKKPNSAHVIEAARLAGIASVHSAKRILYQYRKDGHRLRHPADPNPVKIGRHLSGLDTIADWLHEKLFEWRFLSLEKRTTIIRRQKGITITRPTLSTWYKKNRVYYVNPQYHISNRYTDA